MRVTLLILLSMFLFTACSKDEKSCWGCVLLFSDGYVTSYNDSMICDKTQTEINDMKRRVYDAGHLGYHTYQVNNCSRLK